MPVLTVQHITTYRYRRPVSFGEHRMLFRPRDTADQRLLSWDLRISPDPSTLRSVPDAFGNMVTLARFGGRARELRFENRLVVEHTAVTPRTEQLAPYARNWPFSYDPDDMADLGRLRERHHDDPAHAVDGWARSFLGGARSVDTLDLLVAMTRDIRENFTYCARYEEGVQEPARTLALRNGTCRDYAVLMMEAVRALGLAARFVSGYIFSPGANAATGSLPENARVGGGSTHAWVEVFLPGCGWTDFDPTNAIVGSRDLVRVASVRDWRQAVPLAGTWTGFPADSIGMDVSVTVGSDEPAPATGPEPADEGDPASAQVVPLSPREGTVSPSDTGSNGTRALAHRSTIRAS